MTTRSQKRKAIEELVSTEIETPIPEANQNLNPVAGTSKSPRILTENLEEIRSSLRREIMSDLTKILAENQKEMLKLIAPVTKKHAEARASEETDSDPENIPENATSTPIKTKTTATTRKITPVSSRNMVTGVLNDSTNLGKKKTRPHRPQSLPPNERPSTSRLLFAPQPEIHQPPHLPSMPKALTASLPVFDGKSEKFELFEDLFRNNIKMYPHLTEIQKINYFHSLLRGNALQAYCNLDDAKKDNLEKVITAFKRRFGDFQSSAKARCEWDSLHFDPTKQKLHEYLDTLQKTAKEAFGSEAQKFIDKAIYAKMPDHVKKILNRAYLEDKPYNDFVLHLEREMRLNGLGTPDETTLVPLNTVDVVPPEPKKELTHRGSCFHWANRGIIKHNAANYEKIVTTKLKHRTVSPTPLNHPNQSVTLAESSTKPRTAGTELTQRMTPGRNVTNSQSPPAKSANNQSPLLKSSQKTKNAAPPLRGNGRREGVHNRRPPQSLRRRLHDRMQRRTDTGLATSLERRHDT